MDEQKRGMAESAVLGAVAGGLATVAMSALMFAAKSVGLMGKMPPEKITARALDAVGADRHPVVQDALASLLHIAFGASAGALFAVVDVRLRLPGPATLKGAAYGTSIWGVSYAGWVPALGIMAPPDRDRPGRPQSMLLAHWVFGIALVWILRALGRD